MVRDDVHGSRLELSWLLARPHRNTLASSGPRDHRPSTMAAVSLPPPPFLLLRLLPPPRSLPRGAAVERAAERHLDKASLPLPLPLPPGSLPRRRCLRYEDRDTLSAHTIYNRVLSCTHAVVEVVVAYMMGTVLTFSIFIPALTSVRITGEVLDEGWLSSFHAQTKHSLLPVFVVLRGSKYRYFNLHEMLIVFYEKAHTFSSV